MPACRTSTRSKATSRTSRASTSRIARGHACTPRRGTSACASRRTSSSRRAGSKTEVVAVAPRRRVRRRACRCTVTLTQVQWHERPARRRQRVLHVGHGAQGGAGRAVDGDDGADAGAARHSAARAAATSCSKRRRADDGQAVRRDADVLLRRWATATRRGRATITTASISCRRSKTYKPGDTARIMIQSPWEQATALVTTEREGIRTHRQFALTSTQQSISVPITENDIPERLRLGAAREGTDATERAGTAERRATPAIEDASDPGQAVLPARLRRAEGRGRDEAARPSP